MSTADTAKHGYYSASKIDRIKRNIKFAEQLISDAQTLKKTNAGKITASNDLAHMDVSKIKAEIKHAKADMEKYTPPKVSGPKKDKIYRKIQEIEDYMKGSMLTLDQLQDRGNGRELLKWERTNKALIKQLRNLKKMLEPQDPNAGNLEYLRRGGAEGRKHHPGIFIRSNTSTMPKMKGVFKR